MTKPADRKKILVYSTGRSKTTKLMLKFSNGINNIDPKWIAEFRNIEHFLAHGFGPGVHAVAVLGILRGTGMAMQEAAKQGIDRYYLDHAYFDSGYGGKGWMRISKNRHTMNYVKDVPKDRWKLYFNDKYELKPWKTRANRGNKILVLPPTHAVQWYFNAQEWCDQIVDRLKQVLPEHMHEDIKIRIKPNEPIVDKAGNLIRLEKHSDIQTEPLEQDLAESNVVIAYNSNVALQAMLAGIPVISNQHCSVYPVSFTIDDLIADTNNPVFDAEPDRWNLVKWLSYSQFKTNEIENGSAWQMLQRHQWDVKG